MTSTYKKRNAEWKLRYASLLNDIYQKTDNNNNIAKKYNVSASRVSQLKKELNQLKYKPEIVNGKIKCQICDNQIGLVIHHNHKTGETIAILCQGCNMKVEDNELEYKSKYRKDTELMNEIYNLIKLEGNLSVGEICKKLEEKKEYQKIWHYVKDLLKENRIIINDINRNGIYGGSIYSIKKEYNKENVLYWFKDMNS